jgi:hypothetical protein
LLDVKESQLSVIQYLFVFFCPLLLLLIQLLCEHLIGRVFEVRSESPQVLLFSLVIFLLDFTEFSLLGIESTKNQGCLFAAKVVENCLRDDLADLN